jgi:hypothetical protein
VLVCYHLYPNVESQTQHILTCLPAGIQIFRQAVLDAAITKITVLSRRALPSWMDIPKNDKTEVIILKDFLDYPSDLPVRLAEHDACVWALGKSSVGLSDEEYTRITYDYTMHFVNTLQEAGTKDKTGEPFRFVFISGEGADPSGKSNLKFARIKVCACCFIRLYSQALECSRPT